MESLTTKPMAIRIVLLALLCFIATASFGQPPLEIKRTSDVAIRLEKKANRELKLSLLKSDALAIKVSTKKRVNFRITDPNGVVMHENVAMVKAVEWSRDVAADGVYTLVVENVDQWLSTDVTIQIKLRRPKFTYGSGVAGSSGDRTVLAERSQDVLTDGRAQIVSGTPRKYPFNLERGDTLLVDIKGLAGPVPFVEISNAQKELLFASLPERRRAKVTIPILETGAHELLLYSHFFTNTPLMPMYDSIRVERIAPTRYAPAVVVPVDSTTLPKPIVYDTIAELVLDTMLFAGAVRDYVHPNRIGMDIPMTQPQDIIHWVVLFGAGKEFPGSYEQLKSQSSEDQTATVDPLLAFGQGRLHYLPGPGNPDVRFYPSGQITEWLSRQERINYVRITQQPESPRVDFENSSKSVGHPVYLKAYAFRKVARPQE